MKRIKVFTIVPIAAVFRNDESFVKASAKAMVKLQAIHDHATSMGASCGPASQEKAMTPEDLQKMEDLSKRMDEMTVALAKADAERVELSKQLAVERAELAKIRHADARREVLSRVQQLKALAGSEHEALADDILALQGHDAALAARFEARLVAAHVALAAGGGILDPIGSQRADSGPDPVSETERRAELLCRAKPGLSVAAARVQVWREDPALYAAHHAATMPPAAKPKADDAD